MEGKEDVKVDAKTEGAEAETPVEVKAEEQKTYTQEEVEALKKKMQSDYEKGVQKLHSKIHAEKQTYEGVLEAINKVADDKAYLVECYESNPEVAKIILDKYYGGQDIDEYKTDIGYEIDYNDPKVRQKQIEKEAQKIADKKTIEKSKSDFIAKLKMDSEEQKKFDEAFEERKQLKSFNAKDIEKHLEKAYKEIADVNTDNLKAQEVIAKTMATGTEKSSGEMQKAKTGNSDIQNMLRLY
jgi:hypothetical protein